MRNPRASRRPLPKCHLPHLQTERIDKTPSQAPSYSGVLSRLLHKCGVIEGDPHAAEFLASRLPPRLPLTTLFPTARKTYVGEKPTLCQPQI